MASLSALSMRPRCDAVAVRSSRRGAVACRAEAAHAPAATKSYFVVKNVFKVKEDSYTAFEDVWKTRESHLNEMPGFIRFAMLKCTNIPGKYVSETHWATKDDFENWAKSSQFKASHGQGQSQGQGQGQGQGHSQGHGQGDKASSRPNTMTMLEGPPAPEFYETVTTTSMD